MSPTRPEALYPELALHCSQVILRIYGTREAISVSPTRPEALYPELALHCSQVTPRMYGTLCISEAISVSLTDTRQPGQPPDILQPGHAPADEPARRRTAAYDTLALLIPIKAGFLICGPVSPRADEPRPTNPLCPVSRELSPYLRYLRYLLSPKISLRISGISVSPARPEALCPEVALHCSQADPPPAFFLPRPRQGRFPHMYTNLSLSFSPCAGSFCGTRAPPCISHIF